MTDYKENAEQFAKNMARAAEQYQAIFRTLWEKQYHFAEHAPSSLDPVHISGVLTEAFSRMLADPETIIKHQVELMQGYANLWNNITKRSLGENEPPLYQPAPKDKRFTDETWDKNPMFDFIKQAYLLNAKWIQNVVLDIKGLDKKESQKVDFYTRQLVDALSPSNFTMTNPKVLKAILETNGESLVKGLENLYKDLTQSKEGFNISTADFSAFGVGKNLAITPGKIVYQNDLMQLIQYESRTEQVHEVPLLIIPAWINKYYILDLQEQNSFVRWLLDQGYTVFMISWVNPNKNLSDKKFEDYMQEGPIAALDVIENITGSNKISAIGYCLGGTLLTITLAYLKAKNDNRIASATFLTTLIDFKDAGELCVFIDEEQLAMVEKKMMEEGYYNGREMSYIFSILRANDMIWSFAVNNYLLGRAPFPFDLLYWNADATNLPARTHSYYLRNMYQQNNLVKPGAIVFFDTPIDITTINTPSYFLSTREDHIAPWECTYKATQLFKGKVKFVLSASGHVAGVINPPPNNKYGYWEHDATPSSPKAWLKGATEYQQSWWENWNKWQLGYAGKKAKPREVGNKKFPSIEAAPGTYVKVHVK